MLSHKSCQKGFTLIEMLIAAVVLSIGLLGLAGLQAQSLIFNKSAAQRSQATILAYDIIDRMRANKALAEAGAYDSAFNTGPSGSINCETGTCSSGDMVTYDINQWLCLLGGTNETACTNFGIEGLLLEGDGEITRNGSIVTVTVRWADDRTQADGSADRTTSISVSTVL